MATLSYGTAPWQYLIYGLDVALIAGAVYFGYRAYTAKKAKKEAAAASNSAEGTASEGNDTTTKA